MKKNLIILLLTVSLAFAGDTETSTLTKVGQTAPNFTLETISGKKIELAQLKGKTVLINFFATWCGPCMAELPQVEAFWKKHKSSNFSVIAIGREHTIKELKKFNNDKKFSFKIAADPKREIYSKFAEKYIPRNILIDKSGKIIFQSVGFDETEFEEMLALIKENIY